MILGYSAPILEPHRCFVCRPYIRITFADAFYLATTAGGSVSGNVGQLKEGYQFNALVIDGLEDIGGKHTVPELLERFCYAGDDRNIVHRYLDGNEKGSDVPCWWPGKVLSGYYQKRIGFCSCEFRRKCLYCDN